MYTLIDGKEVAKKVREDLKQECEMLKEKKIVPKFAVILVGEDKASKTYIKSKNKACQKVGIEFIEHFKDENISQNELLELIKQLNEDNSINGILLQSPLPKHLDQIEAFSAIDPSKDVDGFNPVNAGKLSVGQDCFVACTPKGVIRLLKEYNIDIEGKNAVVIGRSNIVGKPLVQLLLDENATVTICHSKTKDIEEITKNADILIAAIGSPKFVKENMVKQGAVVIDVGINRLEDGAIVGDVDFENIKDKTSFITPVPGGVGPMTIAMLLENVLKATKK